MGAAHERSRGRRQQTDRRLTEHDWRSILRVVSSNGSTDVVEQCVGCGVVRHVYIYGDIHRQFVTERWWRLGREISVGSVSHDALVSSS